MHFLNVVPKTLPFIVITSVVVGPAEDRNAFGTSGPAKLNSLAASSLRAQWLPPKPDHGRAAAKSAASRNCISLQRRKKLSCAHH
jgi:hypothetical protein